MALYKLLFIIIIIIIIIITIIINRGKPPVDLELQKNEYKLLGSAPYTLAGRHQ